MSIQQCARHDNVLRQAFGLSLYQDWALCASPVPRTPKLEQFFKLSVKLLTVFQASGYGGGV